MNSDEHKAETEKRRVLNFNYNPPEVSPKPETDVVKSRSITPNRKRSRSKSNSDGPQLKVQRTYPPPLNDFYGENVATSDLSDKNEVTCDICDKCNLVFSSAHYSKLHLNSQSHKSGTLKQSNVVDFLLHSGDPNTLGARIPNIYLFMLSLPSLLF